MTKTSKINEIIMLIDEIVRHLVKSKAKDRAVENSLPETTSGHLRFCHSVGDRNLSGFASELVFVPSETN